MSFPNFPLSLKVQVREQWSLEHLQTLPIPAREILFIYQFVRQSFYVHNNKQNINSNCTSERKFQWKQKLCFVLHVYMYVTVNEDNPAITNLNMVEIKSGKDHSGPSNEKWYGNLLQDCLYGVSVTPFFIADFRANFHGTAVRTCLHDYWSENVFGYN